MQTTSTASATGRVVCAASTVGTASGTCTALVAQVPAVEAPLIAEAAPTTQPVPLAVELGTPAQPVEVQPGEAQPVEAQPVEAQSVEAQPGEAQPVEAEPVEAQPVEAQPVEAQPVEAQPVEAQPVEAQPVEAEPVEAQPVEVEEESPEKVKTEMSWSSSFNEELEMSRCTCVIQ